MSTMGFTRRLPGELGRATSVLATIVLVLTAAPIITMIVMSFGASGTLEFPPQHFGLQWYRAAWHNFVSPDASDVLSIGEAMKTSMIVAVSTMRRSWRRCASDTSPSPSASARS